MLFPVRCYTCGAVIGHKYEAYARHARRGDRRAGLDAAGAERMCCRRMFLGHVDMVEETLCYPQDDRTLDECGTVLKRRMRVAGTVPCD